VTPKVRQAGAGVTIPARRENFLPADFLLEIFFPVSRRQQLPASGQRGLAVLIRKRSLNARN
jgi:hypothetical protein